MLEDSVKIVDIVREGDKRGRRESKYPLVMKEYEGVGYSCDGMGEMRSCVVVSCRLKLEVIDGERDRGFNENETG